MDFAALGVIITIVVAIGIRSVYESYSRQRLYRRIEHIILSDPPHRKS
jgi:hypothetical protein